MPSTSRWTPARPCSRWPAPGPRTKISRPSASRPISRARCTWSMRPTPPSRPRLFIFSGNTLGSFDPLAEIRYVAQCMKPGGPADHRRRNLTTRRRPWRGATIRRRASFICGDAGEPGHRRRRWRIRYDHKRDDRHEGLHLITRYFRAGRDLSATVAGRKSQLERGERIGLNFQYAYTPEAFRWLLARTAA